MGGRGGSGGRGMNLNTQLAELQPTKGMKITKIAQKAFDDTYRDARRYVNTWGDDNNKLAIRTDFGEHGFVSLHTLRGVQALINSEVKNLDMDEKLGVLDKEKLRKRRIALRSVQRGLNLSYKQHKEYWG